MGDGKFKFCPVVSALTFYRQIPTVRNSGGRLIFVDKLDNIMIYIKGLFFGTITLLLSVVAYVAVSIYFMTRRSVAMVPPGGEIGFDLTSFDLTSLFHSPLFWLVAVLGFAVGFIWGLRP